MQKVQTDLGLLADTRGLNKLRELGNGNEKQQAKALYVAAQQFEAMLMQYWVDGMRETNDTINPDSPLHSKYSSFFDDMLTQQRVGAMVQGNATGSAAINKNSITYMITKQFASTLGDEGKRLMAHLDGVDPDAAVGNVGANAGAGAGYPINEDGERFFALRPEDSLAVVGVRPSALYSSRHQHGVATIANLNKLYSSLPDPATMRDFDSPEDFVEKMMPYAVKAVEGKGMNPLVLVAQAALETGWGKHVPEGNNFYGIKAGSSWKGAYQDLASPEFENGRMVSRNSRFRAYPSVLESMQDYVELIKGNERYAAAADKSFDPDRYFEEIQKAGYATDPHYASKLKNIARQIAFLAYK